MRGVTKHVLAPRRDDRGWVVDPIIAPVAGGRLGHLHLASLAPGAVRGNHVHPGTAEYVIVWGGPAEIAWEEGGGVARAPLRGDETVVFEIPAGVPHVVTNTGSGTIHLIAYYFGARVAEWPETVRHPVG